MNVLRSALRLPDPAAAPRALRSVAAALALAVTLAAPGCAEVAPAATPDLSTGEEVDLSAPVTGDIAGPRDLITPPDLRMADFLVTCPGGQKNCAGKCILSSACCLPSDCGAAPDHGTWSCPATTHACQLDCDAGWLACGKACIPDQPRDGGTSDGGTRPDGGTGDGGTGLPPGACTTGKQGACSVGILGCENNNVICIQTVSPTTEMCNGVDDDCDGIVDDGNPGGLQACSTGLKGVCANGTTACVDGKIACNQDVQPSAEKCNSLDDDCDGNVDNGNPGGMQACSTGKPGVCGPGTTACTAGKIVCTQNTQPSTEKCNSLDDDCNGKTDDNVLIPDGIPNSCMAAGNYVISVAASQSKDVKGYVDPSGDDYFTVAFPGVGGAGTYYHPKIDLIDAAGGQYVFYVYYSGDCGGSAQCGKTLTTFEMSYPSSPMGCSTAGNCSDNTPRPLQFVVRVTRANGPPTSCSSYTVRASNL